MYVCNHMSTATNRQPHNVAEAAERPIQSKKSRTRRPEESCSPDWTRTNNLPINSRLLCQLSYRGSPDELDNGRNITSDYGRAKSCSDAARLVSQFAPLLFQRDEIHKRLLVVVALRFNALQLGLEICNSSRGVEFE